MSWTIRAGDCEKDTHQVVAVTDGTITNIGSYSVYLTAEDGTRFDYLHMGSLQVALGDEVKRGQPIGKVSNEFGGTPTTIHLHFNIKQNVDGIGFVFVPPYISLVQSYQALTNTDATGVLSSATCERVRGASFDPDTPDAPNDVHVSVGGTWDDPDAIGFDVAADRATDQLCDAGAATCARGFDSMLPIALLDGVDRDVHVYALDTWVKGAPIELDLSPRGVTCRVFSTARRVRRLVWGEQGLAEWGFSAFFDELPLSLDDVEAIPEDQLLPAHPRLIAAADGSGHWIHDLALLRPISEDAMFAFRLDPAQAEVWPDSERALVPEGPPWPERAALVRGQGGTFYLLDDASGVAIRPGLLGAENGAEPDDEAAGCACRSAGGEPGQGGGALLAAAIGLILGGIRRRRHRDGTSGSHLR